MPSAFQSCIKVNKMVKVFDLDAARCLFAGGGQKATLSRCSQTKVVLTQSLVPMWNLFLKNQQSANQWYVTKTEQPQTTYSVCGRETFFVASHSRRFSAPDFKMQLTSCKGLELYLLCASVSPQPGFVSHAHKHTFWHSMDSHTDGGWCCWRRWSTGGVFVSRDK